MGNPVTSGARQPVPEALPELGPLLGKIVAPPGEQAALDAALEQVRLELLTALFERGARARRALASGDSGTAQTALGGAGWLSLWNEAVKRAARVLGEALERQLRDAAAVSRYPPKRLPGLLPDPEESKVLEARLSAAGIGLETALERLELQSPGWQEALRRAGGELEVAWQGLLHTAHAELHEWERKAVAVREWRRAWWPIVLVGAVLLGVASWLGLMLGGYLPLPFWLAPFANWIWNL